MFGPALDGKFLRSLPFPFISPVPFVRIVPGPVHFPVPVLPIAPVPVHFPALSGTFVSHGNKRQMSGNSGERAN